MNLIKNYFYQNKITSVTDIDIKYVNTSDSIDDILTHYILLTLEQNEFYSKNPNATYIEVYNCKLDIEYNQPIVNTNTTIIPLVKTKTYGELVEQYILERYSLRQELAIINNFTYQGNESDHAEAYGLYQLYRLDCKARAKKALETNI